jgi:riboflavin synthase
MFTGLIQSVGYIADIAPRGGDVRLKIAVGRLDMADTQLGDSIAVNGVCLTAVEFSSDFFCADVSVETLRVTTAQYWASGAKVNLEKALLPTTRLGGHLVSGHVDGVGEIVARETAARAEQFRLRVPRELTRYIAHKGSIGLDGISLTVNAIENDIVSLTIVPHTLSETTIAHWRSGTKVNIEVDLLARYVERLLFTNSVLAQSEQGISEALLQRCGFGNTK